MRSEHVDKVVKTVRQKAKWNISDKNNWPVKTIVEDFVAMPHRLLLPALQTRTSPGHDQNRKKLFHDFYDSIDNVRTVARTDSNINNKKTKTKTKLISSLKICKMQNTVHQEYFYIFQQLCQEGEFTASGACLYPALMDFHWYMFLQTTPHQLIEERKSLFLLPIFKIMKLPF